MGGCRRLRSTALAAFHLPTQRQYRKLDANMYTKRQRNKRILVGVFLAARAATLPVGVAPPKHAQMVAGPFPWQRARARNLAAWSSVPGLRCEMHVELRFGLKK